MNAAGSKSKSAGSKPDPRFPLGPNTSCADAVNNGLACFERRAYDAAVANFTAALTGDLGEPSEDESRAALYNRACAKAKLGDYDGTKADLTAAVNDYALKFSVVLGDPDMEVFRGTPQYAAMEDDVRGFRSNASIANLKAEAQEPFRFFKLYAFGGLGAGAFIGLLIILTRLAAAIKGGEDAPDLGETIGNLAVNAVAVAAFATLFRGELEAREKTQEKVKREEALGRLRVNAAETTDEVLVSQLRGNYRLFLIAGSDAHVESVMGGLAKYKALLKEKNVIVATVDMLTGDGTAKRAKNPGAGVAKLAAEFAAERGEGDEEERADDAPAIEFGKKSRKAKGGVAGRSVAEKRWRVVPVAEEEWRAWIVEEIERSGFDTSVRDVFFSVGKDGTMWKSGAGTPNWMKLVEELPEGAGPEASERRPECDMIFRIRTRIARFAFRRKLSLPFSRGERGDEALNPRERRRRGRGRRREEPWNRESIREARREGGEEEGPRFLSRERRVFGLSRLCFPQNARVVVALIVVASPLRARGASFSPRSFSYPRSRPGQSARTSAAPAPA